MTESRSFAPAAEFADDEDRAAAPPPFPLLPYACTAYAAHCTRDYADYMDRLVHAEEPWVAEETLGLQMVSQMNQAFFALVLGPLGAAMSQARG